MVVVTADIEGGHDLPLECNGVSQQLQNVIKAVKYWCGDYNIKEKSLPRYFHEIIKRANKKRG